MSTRNLSNELGTNKKEERSYCSGIVKFPRQAPKTPEQIEASLKEINERQFDPHVSHMGRLGNIVVPND